MKKTLRYILAAAGIMAAAAGCEKDGEKLIVSTPGTPSEFSATPLEISLSADKADALALTLVWNEGAAATLSDPTVAMPDGLVSQAVQFSASETFDDWAEFDVDSDKTSLQLTGNQLSQILVKLGLTDVQKYNIYVRLAIVLGDTEVYSSVITIGVTPYAMETGWMKVVDKNDGTTVVATLHCKEASPQLFEGFVVTPGTWYNCFFIAADGVKWGSDSIWTAFSLIAGVTNHTWFAEPSGCQYVFADTRNQLWYHIYTPSVDATVDGTAVTLKYSKTAGGFSGTITTTADNTEVKISGTGKRYDSTTGTDASSGTDYPFSLIPSADSSFVFTAGVSAEATVNIAKAGTYTLTFNVTDCTWKLAEGESGGTPVVYPEKLYAWYFKKEASDKLDKATVLNGISGEDGTYQGFLYTSPDWTDEQSGFRFLTTEDDTAVDYHANSAGQYVLTTEDGGWNFWSSNPGLNYITVDLASSSWTETKVKHIAVSGDFNDWKIVESDYMTYDTSTRKWVATCEISKIEWGIKFVLEIADEDWKWQYGDPENDGTLSIGKDGFKPSETGTYKIELDLSSFDAPTYTITKQ